MNLKPASKRSAAGAKTAVSACFSHTTPCLGKSLPARLVMDMNEQQHPQDAITQRQPA
jgi:hypothetical protein